MLLIPRRTVSRSTGPALSIAHTDLDGIIYRGRFVGSTSVAVVERASDAFPQRPVLSLPLSHPGLADAVDAAAYELGYVVV